MTSNLFADIFRQEEIRSVRFNDIEIVICVIIRVMKFVQSDRRAFRLESSVDVLEYNSVSSFYIIFKGKGDLVSFNTGCIIASENERSVRATPNCWQG